jgi:hypothetical protein
VSDGAVFVALVASFAVAVTAHVGIALGLARRAPRHRALLAFFVAPAAPWLALRERMRVRAVLWLAGVVAYVVCRALG